MEMKVEHIGIATRSIEEALRFWRDALGLEVRHTETVEEQGVRVAMLPVGEARIELLEPTGDSSPVAKFLERHGPGIHHVAVRVADIRASASGGRKPPDFFVCATDFTSRINSTVFAELAGGRLCRLSRCQRARHLAALARECCGPRRHTVQSAQ